MERKSFREVIAEYGSIEHWRYFNCDPSPEDIVVQEGNYAVIRVIPAEQPDWEFLGKTKDGRKIVRFGEQNSPVELVDDPWQEAYAIFYRREPGYWQCVKGLFATIQEAKDTLKTLKDTGDIIQ